MNARQRRRARRARFAVVLPDALLRELAGRGRAWARALLGEPSRDDAER